MNPPILNYSLFDTSSYCSILNCQQSKFNTFTAIFDKKSGIYVENDHVILENQVEQALHISLHFLFLKAPGSASRNVFKFWNMWKGIGMQLEFLERALKHHGHDLVDMQDFPEFQIKLFSYVSLVCAGDANADPRNKSSLHMGRPNKYVNDGIVVNNDDWTLERVSNCGKRGEKWFVRYAPKATRLRP